MAFDGPVHVVEDGDYWLLLAPLTYQGKYETFVIPAGFRTDFASVPHALTWLVPRTGIFNRAAVLHDHLCRHPRPVSLKDADGIFRRVLRELGVGPVRRWIMYAGVRIGHGFR